MRLLADEGERRAAPAHRSPSQDARVRKLEIPRGAHTLDRRTARRASAHLALGLFLRGRDDLEVLIGAGTGGEDLKMSHWFLISFAGSASTVYISCMNWWSDLRK